MIRYFLVKSFILILLINFTNCNLTKNSEPPLNVSVKQLVADYDKDESAAKNFYKGKELVISGAIDHSAMIRNVVGIYFKIDGEKSQWRAMCLIDQDVEPNTSAKLDKGKDLKFITSNHRVVNHAFIQFTDCRFAE